MARKRKGPAKPHRHVRDRELPLMVYVNEAEREKIKANADAFGMSVSAFLRAAGQGRELTLVVNLKGFERLAKIRAVTLGTRAFGLSRYKRGRPHVKPETPGHRFGAYQRPQQSTDRAPLKST